MSNKIFDLIADFEGLIGALLGVTLTLIWTQLIKNSGKIILSLDAIEYEYTKLTDYGPEPSTPEEASDCALAFRINLYNSSETMRHLNKFKILYFDLNGRCYGPYNLSDGDKRQFSAARVFYSEASHVNVSPKSLDKINFKSSLPINENGKIIDLKRIEFHYENHKNKNKVFLIK